MARLFESYVTVAWSAASKPATGADSIWIGAMTPDARLKLGFKASNPPTRAKALVELEELLARCLKRGDRVLLGVDFPIGFPAGTAEALKLAGDPWRAVRDFLGKEMKDKPDNANNRFALAAQMNRRMSGGPFPFWGCSKKDVLTTLSDKKTREHAKGDVPEFRMTEEAVTASKKAKPQPVWKIAYAGAVGGQALTGIPAIEKLRAKFPAMKIWPFELPLAKLEEAALEGVRIVVAEVYRGMVSSPGASTEVRDEAQVRTLCEWLAERDVKGTLSGLFNAPAGTTVAQQAKIAAEEGWILGI